MAEAAEGRAPLKAPVLLHLHISKCGGTSLRHYLTEVAGVQPRFMVSNLAAIDAALRNRPPAFEEAALIAGHFSWGLHERLGRDSLYFILLRDPAARVRSLLGHARRTPTHKLHAIASAPGMSLARFYAEHAGLSGEFHDGQVRQLLADPPRTLEAEHLEQALDNLFAPNVVSGRVEAMDAALDALHARLPWTVRGPLSNLNVDADAEPLSPEDALAVRENNRLDQALYEAACARWAG